MATQETPPRPLILLVSLSHQHFFDEMYANLLSAIHAKANVQRVKKATSALHQLSRQPAPSAVLVTDEGPSVPENAEVWEAVLQYVRQGGTAVVMGHFPSFVLPANIEPFFAKAGLPWASGPYHRTTLQLNRDATGYNPAANLASEYSQKALYVKNVALSDSLYVTDEDSRIESSVFGPDKVNTPGETPVAFTRVGNGKLGYLGDVNAEEGSDTVILAMCGLSA
ncbi:hypothetical protein QQZ08_004029 [Neonectria magnoliae]|uniref:ThuA-like domain-containing protein n=1 Tax=Neonectria magnoliae TaxID=2732573 RepID=A0ABR1I9F2_9HYPO